MPPPRPPRARLPRHWARDESAVGSAPAAHPARSLTSYSPSPPPRPTPAAPVPAPAPPAAVLARNWFRSRLRLAPAEAPTAPPVAFPPPASAPPVPPAAVLPANVFRSRLACPKLVTYTAPPAPWPPGRPAAPPPPPPGPAGGPAPPPFPPGRVFVRNGPRAARRRGWAAPNGGVVGVVEAPAEPRPAARPAVQRARPADGGVALERTSGDG